MTERSRERGKKSYIYFLTNRMKNRSIFTLHFVLLYEGKKLSKLIKKTTQRMRWEIGKTEESKWKKQQQKKKEYNFHPRLAHIFVKSIANYENGKIIQIQRTIFFSSFQQTEHHESEFFHRKFWLYRWMNSIWHLVWTHARTPMCMYFRRKAEATATNKHYQYFAIFHFFVSSKSKKKKLRQRASFVRYISKRMIHPHIISTCFWPHDVDCTRFICYRIKSERKVILNDMWMTERGSEMCVYDQLFFLWAPDKQKPTLFRE